MKVTAFDKHKTGCKKCGGPALCTFGQIILTLVCRNTDKSHSEAEQLNDLVDNARFAQAALTAENAPITQAMAAMLLQTTFLKSEGAL